MFPFHSAQYLSYRFRPLLFRTLAPLSPSPYSPGKNSLSFNDYQNFGHFQMFEITEIGDNLFSYYARVIPITLWMSTFERTSQPPRNLAKQSQVTLLSPKTINIDPRNFLNFGTFLEWHAYVFFPFINIKKADKSSPVDQSSGFKVDKYNWLEVSWSGICLHIPNKLSSITSLLQDF